MSKSESIQLAYDEATRALQGQERKVEELRQRTGLLLTGASIVTSVLSAQIVNDGGLDLLTGLAVVTFAATVGCCIWIVLPRREAWRFSLSATVLVEDWVDTEAADRDADAMRKFLALQHQSNFESNDKLLEGLYAWFLAAGVLLGAEVVLWAIKLA